MMIWSAMKNAPCWSVGCLLNEVVRFLAVAAGEDAEEGFDVGIGAKVAIAVEVGVAAAGAAGASEGDGESAGVGDDVDGLLKGLIGGGGEGIEDGAH